MGKYAEGRSQRAFVVADETWQAALAVAADKGITVTSVLVEALETFVATNTKKRTRRAASK